MPCNEPVYWSSHREWRRCDVCACETVHHLELDRHAAKRYRCSSCGYCATEDLRTAALPGEREL